MLLLVFLGGVLTILSPCILPVIPLVFARAERSFVRETLPLLLGLALAFAFAATIATSAAGWLVAANVVGRDVALLMMAAVGVALLSTRAAEFLARPLSRLGGAVLAHSPAAARPRPLRSVGIGAAIGLLWAPCAGPILGLVITLAARAPDRRAASLLFLTFALGATVSLGLVMAAAGRTLARLRAATRYHVVVQRVLGVATLATVVVIALGWDAAIFAKGGLVGTARAEETLVRKLTTVAPPIVDAGMSIDDFAATPAAPTITTLPGFAGATEWINSAPLTPESLRGKVVLVDFWTFACYNCLNALPHVKELYAKYKDQGFVVIGVHTPELARERVLSNVRAQVKQLGITYPVVVDNDYAIWKAFDNQFWPAAYYADASGTLRFHHFGEGRYDEQDKIVAKLLAEAKLAAARTP